MPQIVCGGNWERLRRAEDALPDFRQDARIAFHSGKSRFRTTGRHGGSSSCPKDVAIPKSPTEKPGARFLQTGLLHHPGRRPSSSRNRGADFQRTTTGRCPLSASCGFFQQLRRVPGTMQLLGSGRSRSRCQQVASSCDGRTNAVSRTAVTSLGVDGASRLR